MPSPASLTEADSTSTALSPAVAVPRLSLPRFQPRQFITRRADFVDDSKSDSEEDDDYLDDGFEAAHAAYLARRIAEATAETTSRSNSRSQPNSQSATHPAGMSPFDESVIDHEWEELVNSMKAIVPSQSTPHTLATTTAVSASGDCVLLPTPSLTHSLILCVLCCALPTSRLQPWLTSSAAVWVRWCLQRCARGSASNSTRWRSTESSTAQHSGLTANLAVWPGPVWRSRLSWSLRWLCSAWLGAAWTGRAKVRGREGNGVREAG